ncbi:MAG TPA: ABC transporter permease [Spirochaetia bacterium]|nr:ABC transporter permease [Spirochaetia bacterium]
MPVISVLVILVPLAILRPLVLTYLGLQLLLNMAIPLSLATLAQMFAMAIGEIDFSLGNLVSLVTCVVGTVIPSRPALGLALLAGIIAAYVGVGAILHLRTLSSIVVTIGMSFIWTGLAVTIQPTPGGNVPALLQKLMLVKPPIAPLPVVFLLALAVIGHLALFRTGFGILVRGTGGSMRAVSQAGHSITAIKAVVFGLVGVLGILSGTTLSGITTSADANIASNYTLLSVAGVVLGGGSFAGGRASAAGAVLGACTMTLVGTLLTFLQISPDWQIGSQGLLLLVVLALNGFARGRAAS